ncbi:hypothetical protein ABIE66_001944 [Peribacillus sp. B2I2]
MTRRVDITFYLGVRTVTNTFYLITYNDFSEEVFV